MLSGQLFLFPQPLDAENDKIDRMSKYFGAIVSLLLWASGTGLVLITLSGEALNKAIIISIATLAVNIAAIMAGIGVDD